jgi:nucleotide-binding universal stress UspA family protein
MFKKILVPTDGSEMALQAAKYALALAEKFGSEITLIHVIQNYYSLPAFSMPDTVTIPLSVMQDLDANGKLILANTQAVFSGFTGQVSTLLEYGPPGKQIIDIAVEGNYSLIIMGRRGISGVTELLLGSVSNHIVHYAPCPTLIVKGTESE